MSKKDEALKMALEALEPFITPNWAGRGVDEANVAYAAIREALAEPPPCKYPHCAYPCPDLPDCRDAEQPAQQEPEQSEIFCGVDFADGLLCVSVLRRRADDVAELLHLEQIALPAQQQEPVAWVVEDNDGERLEWAGDIHSVGGLPTFPLYTSPLASKPWVGLTDEDTRKINQEVWGYVSADHTRMWDYARAIEAKLREKNA